MHIRIIALMLAPVVLTPIASEAQEQAVTLGDDRQSILVRDASGSTKSYNVIQACGSPIIGEPRIRAYNVDGSTVQITFGKHCTATLDLLSGQLQCGGCD